MKYFIYFFVILCLVGITGGVFDVFPLFRSVPQLLLVFVAVIAVERKNLDYIFVALVSGIFMDALTGVAFGSYTLSYFAAALLIRLVFQDFLLVSNAWKHLPWIVVIATIVQHIWVWLYNGSLARFLQSVPAFTFSEIILLSLGSSLYTVVLFLPSYWLFEQLNQYLNRLEQTKKY